MPSFLKITTNDNVVRGWHSGSKMVSPPHGMRHVEQTDEEMKAYRALMKQAGDEDRQAVITEADGVLTLAEDIRPYIDITANKTEIDADGVDAVTLTVQRLNPDGSNDTTFDGTARAALFGEWLVKLQFTNGVATKELKTQQSGVYTMISTDDFKLKTPLEIRAYA